MSNVYGTFQEATRNDVVAVGLTSVVISVARQTDTPRKVIVVRNTSPNATDTITVSQSYQGQAIAGYGIVLKQNESYTDAADSGYSPYQGTITAICATATGTLAIFER